MPLKNIIKKIEERKDKTGGTIFIIPKELKEKAEKKGWKIERGLWICPDGHIKSINVLVRYTGVVIKIWCEKCNAEIINEKEMKKFEEEMKKLMKDDVGGMVAS